MQRVYEENEWGKVSKRIVTAGVWNVDCGSCRKESECFTTQGKDLASAYVLCPHLGTGCLYL